VSKNVIIVESYVKVVQIIDEGGCRGWSGGLALKRSKDEKKPQKKLDILMRVILIGRTEYVCAINGTLISFN